MLWRINYFWGLFLASKKAFYRNSTFPKGTVRHTDFKCCYFSVSSLPRDIVAATQLPSNLNDYQLHTSTSEGHIILVLYVRKCFNLSVLPDCAHLPSFLYCIARYLNSAGISVSAMNTCTSKRFPCIQLILVHEVDSKAVWRWCIILRIALFFILSIVWYSKTRKHDISELSFKGIERSKCRPLTWGRKHIQFPKRCFLVFRILDYEQSKKTVVPWRLREEWRYSFKHS
jgi:hypothetical protein